MDGTLNLNQAECLRDVAHIGFTRVHNVCLSHFTDVPWGIGEWAGSAVLALLFLAGMSVTIFVVRAGNR